jgi:saccharopine dehydrogenase-like NADP-dependent oxidoreductase
MGRVIATDLADDHEVTVADVRDLSFSGAAHVCIDLSDPEEVERLIGEQDMAVGALPAALGYGAARAAIAAGRNYVDVAFFAEEASALHEEARAAGVAVLPDCGLAPGITHLVVGRALARAPRQSIHIRVGGVSEDRSAPFGLVLTWSLADLVDEYRRPARYLEDSEVRTAPALSGVERVGIAGVGELEAFFTDGVRTLLSAEGARDITEKTLRWPGHVDAIKPLLEAGTLAAELERQCLPGRDIVCFHVQVDSEMVTLVDRATDTTSAMARTTAHTTAAFARWVASGNLARTGVVPPEEIGRDERAYRFILDCLRQRGIQLDPPLPFVD